VEIGAVALLTGALMGLAALVAALYRELLAAREAESLQPIPIPIEDERPEPRR
jgi:hypothetical protein